MYKASSTKIEFSSKIFVLFLVFVYYIYTFVEIKKDAKIDKNLSIFLFHELFPCLNKNLTKR